MMTIITICLVLITIALIFGSDTAGGLLGCLISLIFWGFVIAAVVKLLYTPIHASKL